MRLVEVFNTWQGEGPDAGRSMTLTRFRRCDRVESRKACPWCDTLVKMRISAEADFDLKDIQGMVEITGGLMITGGEPTYGMNLGETILLLENCNFDICNIETNGHNIIDLINIIKTTSNLSGKRSIIRLMYSPKFFTDEEVENELERTSKIIKENNIFIKVVDDQSKYSGYYLDQVYKMAPRRNQLWIMPQGVTASELIENSKVTFDIVERYRANFSSRNHIIYGFI